MTTGSDASTPYTIVSGDGRLLFASNENSNSPSVLDVTRLGTAASGLGTLIGRIPTAAAPVGMAFSPDDHWLYVTNEVGPRLTTSKDRCASEQRNAPGHPRGLLLRIDVARASTDPSHAINSAILAGCNPVRVAVAPSGGQIWVTARGDNAVLRFITGDQQGSVATSGDPVKVGSSPVGVAVRPDGGQ